MEAVICPKCGRQVTDHLPGQEFATCSFCLTKFVAEDTGSAGDAKPLAPPVYDRPVPVSGSTEKKSSQFSVGGVIWTIVVVAFSIGITSYEECGPIKSSTRSTSTTNANQAAKPVSMLEFGGPGIADGKFMAATSIAVDKSGRIYVADTFQRIQRFDGTGKLDSSIKLTTGGAVAGDGGTIDKIAVADNNDLYAAIDGVIFVYAEAAVKPKRTIKVSPDHINDFVLRKDGTMVLVSSNDRRESLDFVNAAGVVTQRIPDFQSKATNAKITPVDRAVNSIRIAATQHGEIYAAYALGASSILGATGMTYNAGELNVTGFSTDGKFIYKFGQTAGSCGLAIDNQNRFYVSDGGKIDVYKDDGKTVGSFESLTKPAAFTLDAENNLYVLMGSLAGNKVIKRKALP